MVVTGYMLKEYTGYMLKEWLFPTFISNALDSSSLLAENCLSLRKEPQDAHLCGVEMSFLIAGNIEHFAFTGAYT